MRPLSRGLALRLVVGAWLLGAAGPVAVAAALPAAADLPAAVPAGIATPRAAAGDRTADGQPPPAVPELRPAPGGMVRLVSPAPGEDWQAGAGVEIAWEPLAGFSRLRQIEEWEAFLSVDGGARYSVRLTPHLDADLRRVRIEVPDTPTADARLLLRFGDERREEVWIALPGRLTIVAAAVARAAGRNRVALPELGLGGSLGSILQAAAPGEPALPGSPGVVAWQEGTRRGTATRQVVAAPPLLLAAPAPALASGLGAQPLADSPPEGATLAPPRRAATDAAPPPSRQNLLRTPAPLPLTDILTKTRRRNE